MSIPFLFELPWQWVLVLAVALILLGGARLWSLLGSRSAGAEELRRSFAGEESVGERPVDDELIGYVLAAYRNRERFRAAITSQEEIIANLLAQRKDGHPNLLVTTAGIRRQRERYEYRLARMRLALDEADRLRADGLRIEEIERRQVLARADDVRQSVRFGASPRYVGKNLQGVPICTGELRIPPRRAVEAASRQLKRFATAGVVFGLFSLAAARVAPLSALLGLASVAGVIGAVAMAHELLTIKLLRYRFGYLAPIRELSARSGTPELTYLLAAREKGILPRYIIDGVEYFDVNELGDAAVLLRPADAPMSEATLLRPVSATAGRDSSLLAPTEAPEADRVHACDSDSASAASSSRLRS